MVTELRARRRFRPRMWPTLALLLLLPVLIGLGVWQMDRARQKAEIRDAHLGQAALPALELGAATLHGTDQYRRATGTGEYAGHLGILLDNQVHKGRPGYHVLTPFRSKTGGQWILVDRGWVPWGPDRSRLPQIETPAGTVVVKGQLLSPVRPGLELEGPVSARPEKGIPVLWQSIDTREFARVTGLMVAPLLLRLDADAEHGFVREWRAVTDNWVDRHKGYAFQWFALAATLLVLYLILNFKRTDNESNHT